MYINIDDDYYLKYYSNLEETKDDELTPKEALNIGNLFYNLYKPYKNYKPRELRARTEKEQLMLRIQELSFAVNDLNLYLDLYPNDQKKFNLFKKYNNELNKLVELFAEKFSVLELNQDLGTNYTWYKNPWPWEVDGNV